MLTGILHAITDVAVSRRGKFVVLAFWLILAVGLKLVAPDVSRYYNNNAAQELPAAADSQVAQKLLNKQFPANQGTPAILVFYDPSGLGVDDRIHLQRISDWLISDSKPSLVSTVVSPFTIPQATSQLISPDGKTMTMVVSLTGSTGDTAFKVSVTKLRGYLQRATAGSPLQAHVTGPAGIVVDLVNVFSSIDLTLLLSTVGLVFVLLIVLYRSPLLALLPLLAIGLVNMITTGLFGFAASGGAAISQMSTSIATVLLFGAGTDYSIFIVARFREELESTPDKHLAMQRTMRAVGEAITSSAGTVILAMCVLFFTALGLYSALGLTLALTIVVMLLAGLTLVPALLVWLGRSAYWPFLPRYQPEKALLSTSPVLRGFWGRLGQWTVRHRVLAVVGSTVLLVVCALGNIGLQPSLNDLKSIRVAGDATQGYDILQQHFPAGTLAPTTILLQLHGSAPDAYQHLAAIDAVTVALQKFPGVASVQGPTRPDGKKPVLDPATLQQAIASLPASVRNAIRHGQTSSGCQGPTCPQLDQQQQLATGAYAASTSDVSPDGSTVQLSLVFKTDPYALSTIEQIPQLRMALIQALTHNGLGAGATTQATIHMAGETALLSDTLGYNQHDTFLVVPAVLLLVFLILALLLRSLLAPLYLLAAVTLNFLAAIGVCGFFFQRVQGQDGFSYAIPLYTFIFLVALGADYTIFLMSRVREEAQRRGLEVGIPVAVARTGGVITSAGLILAGTFLVLTTLPLTILYQLGVCVAVGILLDTFVVRGLLVPGLVVLLGRWNWWPGRLLTPIGDISLSDTSARAHTKAALAETHEQ